jgi:hypothetical protein
MAWRILENTEVHRAGKEAAMSRADKYRDILKSVPGGIVDFNEIMADMDALESELALNQAAIVREAAAQFRNPDDPTDCADIWDWHTKDYERAVLAIPTDQPALDRYVDERVKQAVREAQIIELQHVLDGDEQFDADTLRGLIVARLESLRAAASTVSEQAGGTHEIR